MYFTMICAEIRFRWKYVATRVAYFGGFGDVLEGFGRFCKDGYIGIAIICMIPMYFFLFQI